MWNRRDTFAALGLVLIAFALFTERLLSADLASGMGISSGAAGLEASLGLRGVRACVMGQCFTSDEHTGSGTLSFVVGLACMAALIAAIALDKTKEEERLWRPAGGLCVAWLLTLIVWYLKLPWSSHLSFGVGMWAGALGGILGALAGLSAAEPGFRATATYADRERDIDAQLASVVVHEPDAASAGSDERDDRGADEQAPPADVTLRFVADEMIISDRGLQAVSDGRESQFLAFQDIDQIVARMLPEELGAVLLLDFVSLRDSAPPLRVLPSTKVNYAYLPDGQSADGNDNARRLISLIRALNPEAQMDEGSKTFADTEGGAPLPFQSEAHYWQYDARYGKA